MKNPQILKFRQVCIVQDKKFSHSFKNEIRRIVSRLSRAVSFSICGGKWLFSRSDLAFRNLSVLVFLPIKKNYWLKKVLFPGDEKMYHILRTFIDWRNKFRIKRNGGQL